jgi:hypothetical protein
MVGIGLGASAVLMVGGPLDLPELERQVGDGQYVW